MMEGVNLTKNFCKCHNVPPVRKTIEVTVFNIKGILGWAGRVAQVIEHPSTK
jgi:hypothetical protein